MKKILILAITITFGFISCETKNEGSDTSHVSTAASVVNLDPVQFQAKSTDAIILDVRTPAEVAEGRIAGSVVIDFNGEDFLSKASELPKDRDILIYCAVGGRSAEAGKLLAARGFTHVYHLSGGINAWAGSGFPIVKD
jgi:rhodanese-related sulfurtransferase